METRGRKPTYGNPTALRTAIDKYFDDCDEKRIFPDYAGMKIFLKISEADIEALQHDSNRYHEDFIKVFTYAKDRRESWLVRKMTSDNKSAQGCLNALKQPSNGGYIDRPQENKDKTLKVEISGVGGWNAFK